MEPFTLDSRVIVNAKFGFALFQPTSLTLATNLENLHFAFNAELLT
jgi:hypothetical protein